MLSGTELWSQISYCTCHQILLPLTRLEASLYLGTPDTWNSRQPPGATS